MTELDSTQLAELAAYREAYLDMAERGKYRLAALTDCMGHIQLSRAELADPGVLEREATKYGMDFLRQANHFEYSIGYHHEATAQAFCLVIEAARLLCNTREAHRYAKRLLELAIEQIENSK